MCCFATGQAKPMLGSILFRVKGEVVVVLRVDMACLTAVGLAGADAIKD